MVALPLSDDSSIHCQRIHPCTHGATPACHFVPVTWGHTSLSLCPCPHGATPSCRLRPRWRVYRGLRGLTLLALDKAITLQLASSQHGSQPFSQPSFQSVGHCLLLTAEGSSNNLVCSVHLCEWQCPWLGIGRWLPGNYLACLSFKCRSNSE